MIAMQGMGGNGKQHQSMSRFDGNDPHNSSRPMPIFHIHGDKDSMVAWIIALTIAGMGHGFTTGPGINSSEEVSTFFKRYTLAGTSAIGPVGTGNPVRKAFSARLVAGRVEVRGGNEIRLFSILDLRGRMVAVRD